MYEKIGRFATAFTVCVLVSITANASDLDVAQPFSLPAQKQESAPFFVPEGWYGAIEVDMDDHDKVSVSTAPAFADGYESVAKTEKMRGFYTMRYSFKADTPWRPYAGAGVGLVAAETVEGGAGTFAGRAMAGFDIKVDERAAFFAEYTYLKSGGPSFEAGGGVQASLDLPDEEHSLTIGFRRIF